MPPMELAQTIRALLQQSMANAELRGQCASHIHAQSLRLSVALVQIDDH
jgi:hypothetical protein